MIALPAITVFRRAGIAAAVLVALAFAPNRASAECGEHVTIQTDATASQHTDKPATDGHGPKLPCHGPNCSDRPSIPFTPPASPAGPTPDVNTCAIEAADSAGAGSRDLSLPVGSGPIDRPTPIYHPPRA